MKKSKIVLILGTLFIGGSLFSSQAPDIPWNDYKGNGIKEKGKEQNGPVETYASNGSTIWTKAVVSSASNYPDTISYQLIDRRYIRYEKRTKNGEISYQII